MAVTKKSFLQYWFLILQFNFSTSADMLEINQSLKEGDHLVSKGSKFALGFFSPGSSSYRYLGIWFHQISERSVVWVANRDNPISDSSPVLSINQYGNLLLYNDLIQKVEIWSTKVTMGKTDNCVVQLLDSGNLVLLHGTNKTIVWQSFDYPTNTQLPGMRFGLNHKTGHVWELTSWKSADDPTTGDYSVNHYLKGTPEVILYKGSRPQWRTHIWPERKFSNAYNYTFVHNKDEMYSFYHINDVSLVVKLIVDHLGYFRWLAWHESDGQWKDYWSAPKYPCDFYARCGAYGVCSYNDPVIFECSCLPGYEPKSPRDWNLRDASEGCIRKPLESSSICGLGGGFVKFKVERFSDTSNAAWLHKNMSDMECEQKCLNDCSCSAYATLEIGEKERACLAWYGEIIDMIDVQNGRFEMYVRVHAVELAGNTRSNGFLDMKRKLVVLVVSVSSAWFAIIIFAYLWLRKKKKRLKKSQKQKVSDSVRSLIYKDTLAVDEPQASRINPYFAIFNIKTIFSATNNFSLANKIGQGGFGSVYKGQLTNGKEVAIKRLSKNSGQGIEEFKNEVMLIAKLQHRNLVKLLGCCIQGEERILIYEYLPNGSLDLFLFDQTKKSFLSWKKRLEIIIGIARGILYLHQDSRLRIIHRDLKSSNILLDEDFNPKISDFGMARILKGDQIQHKTQRVVGTYGYMSPEYAMFGRFSIKSDIFGFGVILLEIISGKRSNSFKEDSSLSLMGRVWELWKEDRALEMVDLTVLNEAYNTYEVLKCIQIALLCVQEDAMDRPTISTVVHMLESTEMALPSPKQPAFIFKNYVNGALVEEGGQFSVNEITISATAAR